MNWQPFTRDSVPKGQWVVMRVRQSDGKFFFRMAKYANSRIFTSTGQIAISNVSHFMVIDDPEDA